VAAGVLIGEPTQPMQATEDAPAAHEVA
jgi:hypothetical protein